MKVHVYGAGTFTRKYLKFVQERFEVQGIFDKDVSKAGSSIGGVRIITPDASNVNEYPVLILINDVKSAYDTLIKCGCKQKMYVFRSFSGGFGFYYPNRQKGTVNETLQEGIWFRNLNDSFMNVVSENTGMPFKDGERRYFEIASPRDFDATGGPCACLRNLWLANEQFRLINNFVVLCPSVVKKPMGMPENIISPQSIHTDDSVKNKLKFDDDVDLHEALWLQLTINCLVDFLQEATERFDFKQDDVFLLQDPYILEAFLLLFPDFPNVFAAYHVQGTVASELGKQYPTLAQTLNRMQENHLTKVKQWIFPSKGAADGFIDTATPAMRAAAKNCIFNVAYNGYEKKHDICPDANFVRDLEKLVNYDLLFSSATFLYRNKGVDRIPEVLHYFKEITGLRIHWILVGDGEMADEVEANIHKYLKEDEYTWYRKRFDNQDNIFEMFKKSDFYIMMHHVSVFDLSTLQAMAYGCVPVLSDVGGNRELCGFGNGFLIKPEETGLSLRQSADELLQRIENLEALKLKNQQIVSDKYDNKSFLKGYRDVICGA